MSEVAKIQEVKDRIVNCKASVEEAVELLLVKIIGESEAMNTSGQMLINLLANFDFESVYQETAEGLKGGLEVAEGFQESLKEIFNDAFASDEQDKIDYNDIKSLLSAIQNEDKGRNTVSYDALNVQLRAYYSLMMFGKKRKIYHETAALLEEYKATSYQYFLLVELYEHLNKSQMRINSCVRMIFESEQKDLQKKSLLGINLKAHFSSPETNPLTLG